MFDQCISALIGVILRFMFTEHSITLESFRTFFTLPFIFGSFRLCPICIILIFVQACFVVVESHIEIELILF
jgi:hypothetical protein